MTTRKMFIVLLIANLLTVALVTAAVQAPKLLASGPEPQAGGGATIDHDKNLVPTVPWFMNYQGILNDYLGNPLTGKHTLKFTIYSWDQALDKNVEVWTETHTDVEFNDGLFSVSLGSAGNNLTGEVFAGQGMWSLWNGALSLGVSVDGQQELYPKVGLDTVPYAHRADYVNRFPAPHYDSGWQPAPGTPDYYTILNHNLGGNTDDYVVDLQFKDTRNPGSLGIHQFNYGGDYDDVDLNGTWGAWWDNLTTSQIQVSRGVADLTVGEFRVRIWRIK